MEVAVWRHHRRHHPTEAGTQHTHTHHTRTRKHTSTQTPIHTYVCIITCNVLTLLYLQLLFELHTDGSNPKAVPYERVKNKSVASVKKLFFDLWGIGYRVVARELNYWDPYCCEFVLVNIMKWAKRAIGFFVCFFWSIHIVFKLLWPTSQLEQWVFCADDYVGKIVPPVSIIRRCNTLRRLKHRESFDECRHIFSYLPYVQRVKTLMDGLELICICLSSI